MNLKRLSFILSFLFCLLIAQLYSQEFRPFNMLNIDFLKEELNLNENQVEKIKKIVFDSSKEIEVKHIDLEKSMLDLKQELLKESVDISKVKSIIDKKAAISGEMELMAIKRDISIKSILTEEQLMKWEAFKRPAPQKSFDKHSTPPDRPDKFFGGQKNRKQEQRPLKNWDRVR